MRCREIIDHIEQAYPRTYALEWDNVGLLAGSFEKEVKKVYIAVDATDEVVADAIVKGSDLLITHHPLIFSGLKRVTDEDFIGRRILAMIRSDMSYYAMHTNYDVMGMADRSCEYLEMNKMEDPSDDKLELKERSILDVTAQDGEIPRGIGRVAFLKDSVKLKNLAEEVKMRFNLKYVKVFGNLEDEIRKVAICPGSGKGMIGAALEQEADVLITGDIDHHTGIDAVAQGLAIIDGGHYGIEKIFVEDMAAFLRGNAEGVEVLTEEFREPFCYV